MNTIPPVSHPGGTADTLILSPAEVRSITHHAMALGRARERMWLTGVSGRAAAKTEMLEQIAAARQINARYRAVLISDPETLETLEKQAKR